MSERIPPPDLVDPFYSTPAPPETYHLQDTLLLSWRVVKLDLYKRICRYFQHTGQIPVQPGDVDEQALISAAFQDCTSGTTPSLFQERVENHPRRDFLDTLMQLDCKISHIVRSSFAIPEILSRLAPTRVELSGQGLTLWGHDPLPGINQALEIKLLLSTETETMHLIRGFAQVSSYAPAFEPVSTASETKPEKGVVCAFGALRSYDQELIHHYIARKQRITLAGSTDPTTRIIAQWLDNASTNKSPIWPVKQKQPPAPPPTRSNQTQTPPVHQPLAPLPNSWENQFSYQAGINRRHFYRMDMVLAMQWKQLSEQDYQTIAKQFEAMPKDLSPEEAPLPIQEVYWQHHRLPQFLRYSQDLGKRIFSLDILLLTENQVKLLYLVQWFHQDIQNLNDWVHLPWQEDVCFDLLDRLHDLLDPLFLYPKQDELLLLLLSGLKVWEERLRKLTRLGIHADLKARQHLQDEVRHLGEEWTRLLTQLARINPDLANRLHEFQHRLASLDPDHLDFPSEEWQKDLGSAQILSPHKVNLSAGGIAFLTRCPEIQPSDKVAFLFQLPNLDGQFAIKPVPCFGQVRYTQKLEKLRRIRLGIEIILMTTRSMDLLLAHISRKQRELLAMRVKTKL